MSLRRVLEAFDAWRAASAPLVLLTVTETRGSTYSKAGHRILLGEHGFEGLVSGGCLEGDLLEHAHRVLRHGQAQLLTYDLRDDNDGLFGLGIGCNGLFRVLLQPLLPAEGYAPFAAIAAVLRGHAAGTSATVVHSTDPALGPGATFVAGIGTGASHHLPAAWEARLASGCRQHRGAAQAGLVEEQLEGSSATVLYAPLLPLPRLLILGAGLDAVPLVNMASQMGWRVTVADHRPAQLGRGDLGQAEHALEATPAELPRHVELEHFSAAVIMTHHLDSDRAWLQMLAGSPLAYIGLLGPKQRRTRLLEQLGATAAALEGRLHGPAGLAIGADSPESIALAILAEIQACLAGRTEPCRRSSA